MSRMVKPTIKSRINFVRDRNASIVLKKLLLRVEALEKKMRNNNE